MDRLWGRSLVRTPIHNSRRNIGDPCAYQLSLRAIAAGPPSVPSIHSLQLRARLRSHIWPVLTHLPIAFNHEMGFSVRVVQVHHFARCIEISALINDKMGVTHCNHRLAVHILTLYSTIISHSKITIKQFVHSTV